MPVRTFDGVDDRISFALGSTNFAFGPGTVAVILKRGRDTNTEVVVRVGASGTSSARYGLEIITTALQVRAGNTGISAPTITATVANGWVLLAVTKATGTVAPRFHKYVFSTDTWTHENGASTMGNSTAPASGPVVGANPNGSSPFMGNIGIAGVWDVVLSDAEVEALVQSEASWLLVLGEATWTFDQASTATAVEDDAGTSDQSAITGTSVTADDVPWEGAGGTLHEGGGDLSAASSMSGKAGATKVGSGDLASASSMNGFGVITATGGGDLSGESSMQGSSGVTVVGGGDLFASSDLSGAGGVIAVGAGDFSASSSMEGRGGLILSGGGALSGVSSMQGAAVSLVVKTGSGNLSAASSMDGAAGVTVVGSGELVGTSTMQGRAVATLTGWGNLSAESSMVGAGSVPRFGRASTGYILAGKGHIVMPRTGEIGAE